MFFYEKHDYEGTMLEQPMSEKQVSLFNFKQVKTFLFD